eukprot:13798311-Alexandrium_andersonii.AAC.1
MHQSHLDRPPPTPAGPRLQSGGPPTPALGPYPGPCPGAPDTPQPQVLSALHEGHLLAGRTAALLLGALRACAPPLFGP